MIFLIKRNIKKIRAEIRALSAKNNFFRKKNGARILLYHSIGGRPQDHPLATRVPTEEFEEEVKEITNRGYNVISVQDFIENKAKLGNNNYLVLTFDDGYKDNFTEATAILQKFNLKATFFITTTYIEGKVEKKWAKGVQREFMNWADIINLSKSGFEVGSHMVHHTDLTALSEDKLYDELRTSRDMISEKIGKPIKVFSYPYGKLNKKVFEVARIAGYIGGCSSFSGENYPDTDSYILKRTEINGYDKINDFSNKLDGFYD